MPRPHILIKEDTLKDIYRRISEGGKIATLVKLLELPMSRETLKTKLLMYRQMLATSDKNKQIKIRNSLFPSWLKDPVQTQPEDWTYEGTMPNGVWKHKKTK